jgi:hypothetical protein
MDGEKDINGIIKYAKLMIDTSEALKSSCLKLERMVGKVKIDDISDLWNFELTIEE